MLLNHDVVSPDEFLVQHHDVGTPYLFHAKLAQDPGTQGILNIWNPLYAVSFDYQHQKKLTALIVDTVKTGRDQTAQRLIDKQVERVAWLAGNRLRLGRGACQTRRQTPSSEHLPYLLFIQANRLPDD